MKRRMKKLLVALAVAAGILMIQWNSYALKLPQNAQGELALNITYETNLVLARYDVDMYVDGEKVATLSQGENLQQTLSLSQGRHEILFKGDGVTGTDMVDVALSTYYTCSLKAHMGSVEVRDLCTNGYVTVQEQQKYAMEKYRNQWKPADYERYARFPEEFKGDQILVAGKAVAVSENAWGMMKIVVQDEHNQLWIVEYMRGREAPRILTNDSVEVFGYGRGITTFRSSVASYPLLPTVRLDYVDIQDL